MKGALFQIIMLLSLVTLCASKKLLFAHIPNNLAYYSEYMQALTTHYETIWLPSCSIIKVEHAIIKHKLGPSDVVFFNQGCSNHFNGTIGHSTTLNRVDCRIFFLNKEYTALEEKIAMIKSHNPTIVLTHHHAIAELKKKFHGVPVARVPFASGQPYSRYATENIPYLRDLGHSGNSIYYSNDTSSNTSTTLSWRQKFHQLESTGAFKEAGVQVTTVPFSKSITRYIRNMAESKIWFSTTSQGDLLPQRTFEVLASGRSLLLMNRPSDPSITAGIITEDIHCAMFNTTEEMLSKAVYYSSHEEERLEMVARALKHARESHFWKNRADVIKFLIDDMNCGI